MKRRSGGNAAFSEASAGRPARSVRGSSATALLRSVSRAANAAAVVLKSVMRLLSWTSLRSSASAVAPAFLM